MASIKDTKMIPTELKLINYKLITLQDRIHFLNTPGLTNLAFLHISLWSKIVDQIYQ